MSPTRVEPRILRFGAFELDLPNSELRRGGVLLKLSPQQFRLLRYLAENPGRISTREEIQQNIWGAEVFVDFDRSLNVCVAQLRAVLHDDSEAPRFIQTVPRQGYRFVAPVERVENTAQPPPAKRKTRLWMLAAGLALTAAPWLVWRLVQPPARIMMAVLPFDNVTHRAEDEPILEGLLDEVLTDLGTAVPGRIGVIGRRSVKYYTARNAALPQIARELGVQYVIEGEARWENGRRRISARLVRARDQQAVWAETYEGGEAAGFELEEETSARIVAGVVRALYPNAAVPRTRRPAPEAYQSFLKGRYWQQKDARQAIDWFEQAARRDSDFAAAYSAIAETATGLALSGSAPAESFEKACRAAEQALRLDESSAEAHNAMARVLFWRDWNFPEAGSHYRRALALNPSFAQAWHDYAFWQIVMGHPEAGVAALRRAIALDPLSARVNVDAGWVLLQAHHFTEAAAQAQRALDLEPGNREAEFCLARAKVCAGGRPDEPMLNLYRRRSTDANAYTRALAAAVLGRGDEAITALQAALEQHDTQMPLFGTEPAFSALHRDARFNAIRRKVGLPEGATR